MELDESILDVRLASMKTGSRLPSQTVATESLNSAIGLITAQQNCKMATSPAAPTWPGLEARSIPRYPPPSPEGPLGHRVIHGGEELPSSSSWALCCSFSSLVNYGSGPERGDGWKIQEVNYVWSSFPAQSSQGVVIIPRYLSPSGLCTWYHY